jgi:hypothetical protein
MYSSAIQDHQIKAFLALANDEEEHHEEEAEGEAPSAPSGRAGTLAERVLGVLVDLENNLQESLNNLK